MLNNCNFIVFQYGITSNNWCWLCQGGRRIAPEPDTVTAHYEDEMSALVGGHAWRVEA
jgi:hypothetical protein